MPMKYIHRQKILEIVARRTHVHYPTSWKISRPLSGFWCLDDNIYVRLIPTSSMCAGAKVEHAKHMMKYDPSKGNEEALVEIYSKSRLLFCFWV
jgi:hypothetical protein